MRNLMLLLLFTFSIISCKQKEVNNTAPLELNIMTFNVRYDNPDDSLNNWQYRKERVANAIRFYDADMVGTQEVLNNQMEDLQRLLSNYEFIGVGREDGKKEGEYSAIFYKKDQFKIIDSGYFWLSETPDIAGSKGWDGACERMATWVKIEDVKSSKSTLMLNTHLDHRGETARLEGVKLILKKVKEIAGDLPIIVTGDFNATPETSVIQQITNQSNENYLLDARSISPIVYGPTWSFHDFGKVPVEKRPLIDYIFVSDNVKVKKYGVLAENEENQYLSDHNPIFIKAEIN